VVDGQSRTIDLSTISTFEGPTSHTQECLAWIFVIQKMGT
jgi:hypothetical protein